MIDRMKDLQSSYGPKAEELKEKALDLAATSRERAAHGIEAIREYTIHQPARALGVALGMGVLLGWLIKRR